MVSRIYTVDDGDGSKLRCYKGFNQDYVNAPVIAIVSGDEETHFWALDEGKDAKNQFLLFLVAEGELYDIKFYQLAANATQERGRTKPGAATNESANDQRAV